MTLDRFTDRARRVAVLAQEEARLLNHHWIGTEHVLLGLIDEGEGVAATALESLGISFEAVRSQVEEIVGHGASAPSGRIPFTPRVKKLFELSLREALQLGDNYIGTEHILLGLIREGEGVAAKILVKLGADLSRVRQQVIQLLSGETSAFRRRPSNRSRPNSVHPVAHSAWLFEPGGFAELAVVGDAIRGGIPVLVDARHAEESDAQRIDDFLAGLVSAIPKTTALRADRLWAIFP